jgi:putative hemolysin
MKRLLIAAAALPLLVACSNPPDTRQVLMDQCYSKGGTYFEYEATSAGAHVWCVAPNGAKITLDGGE